MRDLESIIGDEQFGELVRRSSREYLPWDEFLDMRMPARLSATRTWAELSLLRYESGIRLPFVRRSDHEAWYSATMALTKACYDLERVCRPDSPLARLLSSGKGSHFVTKCQVKEVIGAARQDGIILSEERAGAVVKMGLKPYTAEERLLSNMTALMNSLDAYRNQPFSSDLMEHFLDAIASGVSMGDLRSQPRDFSRLAEPHRRESISRSIEVDAEGLWRYANGVDVDPYEHPIMRALLVRTWVSHLYFESPLSSLLTQLAFSLFARKNDLPVLSVAPISAQMVAWIETHTDILDYFFDGGEGRGQAGDRSPAVADLTFHAMLSVRLTEECVSSLDKEVRESEQEASELVSQLRSDAHLNHRQYSLINFALRNPEAEMTIRYHQMNHKVSYATARADYMKLVEEGYFVQRQRGKAFVFAAHPNLPRIIGRG
ncbi:hypothetical protein VJ923_05050 [Adlercreutzia sp. R25]|uniref:Fido domain-containing protein n=1 Tax=Adlercreutzia shanghongiae TaxID=3111773 RepID=A0ABU6IXK9_9ACTN|nr:MULTISPECIES: hypothetical protein [unclassified Adlercreutzia]MEC4272527.1 hypothetical protein [Adlercreutzia sp. R25]MEC4294573.1 hypothetical protein [Adlercreutzia sp. R22]